MFRAIHKIVGTKDYINYKLTGRLATDYSYASGSGVYDLLAWDYSDELLAAAELPRSLLPEIVLSQQILGPLTPAAAGELGLPREVQVACGGVDNSCMALGARNAAEGRVYASLGSSSWIAVSSSRPLLDERAKPYVFTHVVPGMFTSAVSIFSSGTSLKWVRDQLCGNLAEGALRPWQRPLRRDDRFGRTVARRRQGTFVQPQSGRRFGAGCQCEHPRGLAGSRSAAYPGRRIRATLEGIALNLRLALDELRRLGPVGGEMVVVGGGSRSKLWRQIFADAWEIDILKTNVGQEAGSLGAAAVAAVAAGLWDDFSRIDRVHELQERAVPCPEHVRIYRRLLPVFRQAAFDQSRLGDMLAGVGPS